MTQKFGFVKIKSGIHKGKIARYIGNDEKGKAHISFRYDQEVGLFIRKCQKVF